MSQPKPSVIRKYILFQFFFNLLLWIPVFYEFQKRMGLSDPEIFGIQSIYYIVFCLLEVPTGIVADRFGYRCSMLLGAGTLVAGNILPVVHPDYAGFLVHFLMIALARSLISGAASAYMYEYMKAHGAAAGYKKVEAEARFWTLVGRIAAWAAVGWLMTWHLASPYWISALNAAAALAICVAMPSVTAASQTGGAAVGKPGGRPLAAGNVGRAVVTVARSPLLIVLMLQGVGIFVMVRVLQVNLYQPLLTSKGFDVTTFGWLMSLMTVFEAVGSKLAPKLRHLVTDMTGVTLMTLVLSVSLLLIAVLGRGGVLANFCLFSMASGVAFPIQRQVMNDAIVDSSLRSTVLSIESIMDRAVCAVAVLPLAGLVQGGRLATTLVLTGAATAAAAVIVHVLGRALACKEAQLAGVQELGESLVPEFSRNVVQ